MELSNFLEFLCIDDNFLFENYVEKLCLNVLAACKNEESWNANHDQIITTVCQLNGFIQSFKTRHSQEEFNDNLNELIKNTFTDLLNFYLQSSRLDLTPACQLISLCTKTSVLSDTTLKFCRKSILEFVESFFERLLSSDISFDENITTSNERLTQLIGNCVSEGHPQLISSISCLLCDAICSLNTYNDKYRSHVQLFHNCLVYLLNTKDDCKNTLQKCLSKIEDFVYKLSLPILRYLTRSTGFQDVSRKNITLEVELAITILHVLFSIDLVQSANGNILITFLNHVLSINSIWCMIHLGIYHNQSSTRKKTSSLFLLIIRYFEQFLPDLQVSWKESNALHCEEEPDECLMISLTSENFVKVVFDLKILVQICEILEERQIHLVKPVLTKIVHLFDQKPLNHHVSFSWIFPILQRMFSHESKQIQKEGLAFFLDCKLEDLFLQQPNCFSFLCDGLLEMLGEDFLYLPAARPAQDGSDVAIGFLLKQFLSRCLQNGASSRKFMKNILHGISSLTWSPVSLLYLCKALQSLPFSSAWDDDDQFVIRKLFVETICTHDVTLKNEIKRVLIKCVMLHCDPTLIFMDEFLQLLLECMNGKAIARGSVSWKQISQWFVKELLGMKHVLKTNVAMNIVDLNVYRLKSVLSDVFAIDVSSRRVIPTPQHIALCYCLTVDGLSLTAGTKQAEELVQAILSIVGAVTDKAATHVYMPQKRVVSAFAFMHSILEIAGRTSTIATPDLLHETSISPYMKLFKGVLEYVSRKLPSSCVDLDAGKLYLSTVEKLMEFLLDLTVQQRHKLLNRASVPLVAMAQSSLNLHAKLVKGGKLQKDDAHRILLSSFTIHWFCKLTQQYSIVLEKPLMFNLTEHLGRLDLNGSLLGKQKAKLDKEWTQIFCDYTDIQWACVPYSLHHEAVLTNMGDCQTILDQLNERLDVVSSIELTTLFIVAQSLLKQIDSDSSNASATCIRMMWKACTDSFHSPSFRALYKLFIAATFQPCILSSTSGSPIRKVLDDVFSEISFHSKLKLGLLYDVIIACKGFWLFTDVNTTKENGKANSNLHKSRKGNCFSSKDLRILDFNHPQSVELTSTSLISAKEHNDFFLHCLTYSPPATKTSKSSREALVSAGAAKEVLTSFDEGTTVNLVATSVLLALTLSIPEHVKFGNDVLHSLLQRDDVITKEQPRCHLGSSSHLMKQKIWQNILLLLPFVSEKEAETMIRKLASRLSMDIQASVRHLVEWALVLLLFRFRRFEEILTSQLERNVTKSSSFSCISSFLSILLLCGASRRHDTPMEEQNKFFLDLVKLTLPWCMSQHFSIRLYGNAVLHKVDQHFKDQGKAEMLHAAYPSLPACLMFADSSSGNVVKNWRRIKEHFMLFQLDPLMDYSIESIFISFPALCQMEPPSVDTVAHLLSDAWLPLHNKRDVLWNLSPSCWVAAPGNQRSDVAAPSPGITPNDLIDDQKKRLNMQKKIVVPDQSKSVAKEGLVLVASLIDKPSNLGGLTRTCEVFGAERIVVNSVSCVEDKLYQALSVTAHKWVRMEEVKKHQLSGFLTMMKKEGYTIVGVEQTEQSICLTQYKFPKKSVVVLGNEKEGITASLLPLLDVCLEIPQMGVVRSLNVHVSGAVVMWEYRKQCSM